MKEYKLVTGISSMFPAVEKEGDVMRILFSEDFKSKDEIKDYLISRGAISANGTISIDEFLHFDLSINLELLELAIEFLIVDFNVKTIYMINFDAYCIKRYILEKEDIRKKEARFLLHYVKAVAVELSFNPDIKVTLE